MKVTDEYSLPFEVNFGRLSSALRSRFTVDESDRGCVKKYFLTRRCAGVEYTGFVSIVSRDNNSTVGINSDSEIIPMINSSIYAGIARSVSREMERLQEILQ